MTDRRVATGRTALSPLVGSSYCDADGRWHVSRRQAQRRKLLQLREAVAECEFMNQVHELAFKSGVRFVASARFAQKAGK